MEDSYSLRYNMAHVTSVSVEQEDGFYLYPKSGLTEEEFWDKVMSGKLQPIAGPYVTEDEANYKSELASQIVGEGPIEEYAIFLSSPITSTPVEQEPQPPPREYLDLPGMLSEVKEGILGHFEGPVGDKRFKQPTELDWKTILWPWLDVTGLFERGEKQDPQHGFTNLANRRRRIPEWRP